MGEIFQHLDVGTTARRHGVQGQIGKAQQAIFGGVVDRPVPAHVGRLAARLQATADNIETNFRQGRGQRADDEIRRLRIGRMPATHENSPERLALGTRVSRGSNGRHAVRGVEGVETATRGHLPERRQITLVAVQNQGGDFSIRCSAARTSS